jgi:RNase P/RNase MRP subunit p30
MIDIVSAENLPKADGIDSHAAATALKNFVIATDGAAARAGSKRKDVLLYVPSYEFDDGVCQELKRSGGALVFSLADVLRQKGFRRAITLSKMRLALAQCRNGGCSFAVVTLAKSEQEVRNGRELVAFAAVLGMNPQEKKIAQESAERLIGGEPSGGSAGKLVPPRVVTR